MLVKQPQQASWQLVPTGHIDVFREKAAAADL